MTNELATLLAAFDDSLDLPRACTIPSEWYTHPALAELERSAVFGSTWQAVGRTDQVRESGQYFTADVAGEPILVVRGDDGKLRAFSNVCRHRAARVASEAEGCATRFRCRYHGWTYDLQGRLRGLPEFEGVADFPREANGLPELAAAEWGPLVFVFLGKHPPDLMEFLQPLPARSAGLGIETLRFVDRRVYDLACNWKVFVDNYLDGGYHVHTIHPSLAGVLDYAGYHTVNEGSTSVQISPLRKPEAQHEDASAADVRQGDNAYYWWVFPNLMINLYSGVMDTNLVLPLGPERCRVVFDFYFAETADAAAEFNRKSMAVGHQIQLEDVDICEDVQRGLHSRFFRTGRYSVRRESGVYHFHRLLAAHLRRGR